MDYLLDDLLSLPPYEMEHEEKERLYKEKLTNLTWYHYERCPEYRCIINALGITPETVFNPKDVPLLPVRLFKDYDLMSVKRDEVIKTMTSSGTSGQKVSKIYLDRRNSQNQTRVLSGIISSYIGKQRLPLLVLDTGLSLKNREMFSARGAGIIGFATFGRKPVYALDEKMELDLETIRAFLRENNHGKILLFGYTFVIWKYIVQQLEKQGEHIDIKDGILFHIGGWKKLKDEAVDAGEFNRRVRGVLGNVRVHNYYGMVEQLGSIYAECECGNMHASIFSDVIIRDPQDFSDMGLNRRGIIELLSLLPTSYPGHALLTEDEGEILGEDDCPCGRKGKYFRIYGRLHGAEIRGCSDTHGN